MAGVAPLLAGVDRYDLSGHYIPQPTRAEGDDTVASQQAAASSALFDGERDKLDEAAQVEVVGCGFVLPFAA